MGCQIFGNARAKGFLNIAACIIDRPCGLVGVAFESSKISGQRFLLFRGQFCITKRAVGILM